MKPHSPPPEAKIRVLSYGFLNFILAQEALIVKVAGALFIFG